uniref:Uncharacterized protein n=1 Tax=Oryza glumipatula TaxID=40148 RepID=A0A0D9YWN1_9ORYZ
MSLTSLNSEPSIDLDNIVAILSSHSPSPSSILLLSSHQSSQILAIVTTGDWSFVRFLERQFSGGGNRANRTRQDATPCCLLLFPCAWWCACSLCRCVDSESLVLGGMDPWPWLSALVRRRLAVKNVSNPLRTEDTPLQHAPGLSLSWSRGSC